MKLTLLNTPQGLKPCYDDDYDAKKMLKIGEVYTAEIRLARNYELHKKAFALVNAAWSYLPEKTQNGFRSVEGFRDYLTVASGYYKVYYNRRLHAFVEAPKTWNFGGMDNAEFSTFYERLKDTVFGVIQPFVTREDFEQNLANF
jgi:hypothetical protein